MGVGVERGCWGVGVGGRVLGDGCWGTGVAGRVLGDGCWETGVGGRVLRDGCWPGVGGVLAGPYLSPQGALHSLPRRPRQPPRHSRRRAIPIATPLPRPNASGMPHPRATPPSHSPLPRWTRTRRPSRGPPPAGALPRWASRCASRRRWARRRWSLDRATQRGFPHLPPPPPPPPPPPTPPDPSLRLGAALCSALCQRAHRVRLVDAE